MPIQEALVMTEEDLRAPCGVSFDVPGDKFGVKEHDRESWAAEYDATAGTLRMGGWVVIVLIQTRNVRKWSPMRRQFAFVPAEDYLVSAWLVEERHFKSYRPGMILERWFGEAEEALGLERGSDLEGGIYKFWNCHAKSCKLSLQGPVFMIKNLAGKSHAEAVTTAKNSFVNSQLFGWKGGTLPKATPWEAANPNANPPFQRQIGGHRRR